MTDIDTKPTGSLLRDVFLCTQPKSHIATYNVVNIDYHIYVHHRLQHHDRL